MDEVIFTVQEVAKLLKCNKNYVYSLIKNGHLNALKLGQLKVPAYELEDFLKRNLGKDFTDLKNVAELSF
ncbi:DNA-binding protein [Niallia circulans]|uniref:helix-turn-helix domain-containing protein n=1 Tax=Niallia circulans TaxID=1397 RepID=UPI00201D5A9B|nr:helix-turn-helix domain-containing protein [Niallia circulans]UQZ76868.1 DNA-binding protein [Niallia circulans]